ncbi:DNA repair protein RadA [Patescibacteria group bacterium]
MAKVKSSYICGECGYESPKWTGKCPSCEAWNSFSEQIVEPKTARPGKIKAHAREVSPLVMGDVKEKRIPLKMDEINRVLGGGIMEGSLMLLTGEPGIGKSTLTLQICDQLSGGTAKVLYISGEESQNQIASRAARLGIKSERISFLAETNLDTIMATVRDFKPDFIVVDSVQVMQSSDLTSFAGSIGQIRYTAERFMEYAKTRNAPVLLIGHVTKDGNIAGPRVLEHLVDTVLYLEGDRYKQFRILRSEKNRFGSTNEIGIFEMASDGLREVANPSAGFLEGRKIDAVGSAITVTMEGTRPLLVEVQALSNLTPFGYPKRTSTGFDVNRAQLLISVLQKYAKINLANQDIFVNVVGGMRIKDPACDLGVLMAIASSFLQKSIPSDTCFIGEVGLSGEIRSVAQIDKRVKEAKKLGFKKVITPKEVSSVLDAIKSL